MSTTAASLAGAFTMPIAIAAGVIAAVGIGARLKSDSDLERVYAEIIERAAEIEEATDEVLADPELVSRIEQGQADVEAGKVVDWEEVRRG